MIALMDTSSSPVHFIFLLSTTILSFFCLSAAAASHAPIPKTKARPFILSIKKDTATKAYYTSVGIGTPRTRFNLVIDLSREEQLWYGSATNYNSSSYTPIECGSNKCPDPLCGGCITGPLRPGCTNNTCAISVINTLGSDVVSGSLGEDIIFISKQKVSGLLSGAVNLDDPNSPIGHLPKRTKGVIGLARSNLSIPAQLALANKLPPKFSLCLPSSKKRGFTNFLVGYGSHTAHENDLLKLVQKTTPLVVNPFSTSFVSAVGTPSKEYFIDVKSVKIDRHVVNISSSLWSIDNEGNGGTSISTTTPFTELITSVYKPFIHDFLMKASDRKLKRVESVAPFEACFDLSTIGNSSTGLAVPTIDLELQGGVEWTIYGANSMVKVKKNVACLGFVERLALGPSQSSMSFVDTSIVIGGHQLEDNLLVFDLASSKLSFSSSLLIHNMSCNHS